MKRFAKVLGTTFILMAIPAFAGGPGQAPAQAPSKAAASGQAPAVAMQSGARRTYSYEPTRTAPAAVRSYSYEPGTNPSYPRRYYDTRVFMRSETAKNATFRSVQQYGD